MGPFLAEKKCAQQGYSTNEPVSIKTQAGFDPMAFLLADNGFSTYSATIETRTGLGKT